MEQKKRNQYANDFSPTVYHFNSKNTNVGDRKWRVLHFIETTMS